MGDALHLAGQLVLSGDPDLWEIVLLSLRVSLIATLIACIIGLAIGSLLAVSRFRGRSAVLVVINALMGLPPVVVGLIVYLNLSRSGPLGFLGLLYTPTAMIIAQTILITPIIAALSRQILEDLNHEYAEQFRSFGLSRIGQMKALLWDGRFALLTVALAGFGRAVAEGGVMTTAIALETSKGDLPLALALGMILLTIALVVNGFVQSVRSTATRAAYA